MIETTVPLPMLKMVGVFMGVTVLIVAGIAGFAYFWPEVELPNSLGTATSIGAALAAGQFAAKRTRRLLTGREKLTFAALATATSFLAVVGFLWALFAYYGVPFTMMGLLTALFGKLPDAGLMGALPWIALFAVAVSLLVIYFFVGLGAKQHLKMLERQAAKGK
ncbi:MAG TPA: ABZJ_00895 family protein [Tabrizicola sp.]|nr:ABZJ_00895 family protein [Tabrizicola sp.]